MLNNLEKYEVVLASQSPRRRTLLKELLRDFKVTSVEVKEIFPAGLTPEEAALYLAQLKARAFDQWDKYENPLLITADTIVCFGNKILGKPENADEAKEMLGFLSGKVHEVISGVCIKTPALEKSVAAKTKVHFKELEDEEINYYVTNYKPFDKAGSYGIQEWIGYIGVDSIEGSFYNVMGLPVQKLYKELRKF
mgnify:CR=1 FL=1